MGTLQNRSLVDLLVVYLLRPLLAIAFVATVILLSWYVAFKTVLVHVPLVQEVFGLKEKKARPPKPPQSHRISRFYRSLNSGMDAEKDTI